MAANMQQHLIIGTQTIAADGAIAALAQGSSSPRCDVLLGLTAVGSSLGSKPNASCLFSVFTPCFESAQSAESKNL